MTNAIVAIDENGKTWNYEVEVFKESRQTGKEKQFIVSIGFPMQWYYDDIKATPSNGDDKVYIDASGRNHAGTSVWISHSKLMEIVQSHAVFNQ